MNDIDSETVQAIAELKAAMGQVWKKVDQLQITSETATHQIQKKLDQWIQTNHLLMDSNQKLIDAILAQSQETVRSMQYFEQGIEQLSSLSEQLQHIEPGMIASSQGLTPPLTPSLSPERLPLKQIQALSTNIDSLKQTLQPLTPSLSQVQQGMTTLDRQLKTQNQSGRNKTFLLGAALGIALFLLGTAFVTMGDLSYLKQHLNQTLWKLQAIEKRQ